MTFAPVQAYHGKCPETPGGSTPEAFEPGPYQAGPTNIPAATGPEELPDCRLPEAVRRHCKLLARRAAEALNPDALMFLAAAIEVEAKKKHARLHGRRA